MDAERTLAQARLFKGMSPQYLARLVRVARERNYAAGDNILREGDPGIGFFIIGSGACEVLRGSGPGASVINRLGPGDTFGEMALLNESPRMATVRATTDVTCLALTRLDLLDAVRDQPEVAIHMLRTLSELLRQAEERAEQATTG